jgi:pimeloyl-ACP methyl ester carboxylesterase
MNAVVEPGPRTRRFTLPSRGGVMAALDFGPEERPVDIVFSHANSFNARTYRSILAPLAAELRILALDLRGHGASCLPAETAGWAGWRGFAADLIALLEVAVDRPVVLAGHSLGATSSLLAALEAPARAVSLVLFEPVLLSREVLAAPMGELALTRSAARRRESFPDRAAALAAYRGRGAFATWSEAQLADYVAAGFRDTADGQVTLACRPEWEALTYAVHAYDPWRALDVVACPVRILAGDVDSAVAPEARSPAARGRLQLDIVHGASHFLPMERPQLVRDALREAVG